MNSNDNVGSDAPRYEVDRHGGAAMLLVESLIHGLIKRGLITTKDAVEIVDTAAEVQGELLEHGAAAVGGKVSMTRLNAISASLRHDLDTE